MSLEREILRMWERGVSQREIAFVFDESEYSVRKTLRGTLNYEIEREIHDANAKTLRRSRAEKARERQSLHPNETKRASRFYVRSHEALGRLARYNPDEIERLRRILEREGSP